MRDVQLTKSTPFPAEWREAIEQGETLIIRGEDGRQIAQLVPEVSTTRATDVKAAIAELRRIGATMQPMTLDELLAARHEGHER